MTGHIVLMIVLNWFLLPGAGPKAICLNSFANIYLQIWIEPVNIGSKCDKLTTREEDPIVLFKPWSVKWSVVIVDVVLQLENLIIYIILETGFPSFLSKMLPGLNASLFSFKKKNFL